MTPVSESTLKELIAIEAVKQLTINQTESGAYRVVINLWNEGDLNLVTSRKTIREWASLDRLTHRIQHHYGVPPVISLSLTQRETEHQ